MNDTLLGDKDTNRSFWAITARISRCMQRSAWRVRVSLMTYGQDSRGAPTLQQRGFRSLVRRSALISFLSSCSAGRRKPDIRALVHADCRGAEQRRLRAPFTTPALRSVPLLASVIALGFGRAGGVDMSGPKRLSSHQGQAALVLGEDGSEFHRRTTDLSRPVSKRRQPARSDHTERLAPGMSVTSATGRYRAIPRLLGHPFVPCH